MTIVVAHRGDPALWRENTLAGLDSAADAGADWVEVDVKLTADGEVVLLHDPTLHRLWDVPRAVAELTFEELARLTHTPEHRIPTLDEALAWTGSRGVPVMVDIPAPAEGVATACRVLEAGLADHVVFAGDPEALAEVRGLVPDATIAISWELPGLPDTALLDRVRPQFFNQVHLLLDEDAVRAAAALGLRVCAYTVDDEPRMAELVALGVDALITNDVRALRRVLGAPAPAPIAGG